MNFVSIDQYESCWLGSCESGKEKGFWWNNQLLIVTTSRKKRRRIHEFCLHRPVWILLIKNGVLKQNKGGGGLLKVLEKSMNFVSLNLYEACWYASGKSNNNKKQKKGPLKIREKSMIFFFSFSQDIHESCW